MKQHCIIFVHGLFGSKESFINKEGKYFEDYLSQDVRNKYDFDHSFIYYTKMNFFNLDRYLLFLRYVSFMKKIISPGYNNTLADISRALLTKYNNKIAQGYKSVSFICHSMGGIITKKMIIDMLKEGNIFSGIYITLATPHQGVDTNKIIHKLNRQIIEISENSDFIQSLEEDWGRYKNQVTRRYYGGGGDPIVLLDIAFPKNDLDIHKITVQNEDHDTISKPISSNSDLMTDVDAFLTERLG